MQDLEFPRYDHLCGGKVFFRYDGEEKMSLVKIVRYDTPDIEKVLSFIQSSAKEIMERHPETPEEPYMQFIPKRIRWILPRIVEGGPEIVNYLRYNLPVKFAPGYIDLQVGSMSREKMDEARPILETLGPIAYRKVMKDLGTDLWFSDIPIEGNGELYGHKEYEKGKDVIDVLDSSPDIQDLKYWAMMNGKEDYERVHEHLDLVYSWFDSAEMVSRIGKESEIPFLSMVGATLRNATSSFSRN